MKAKSIDSLDIIEYDNDYVAGIKFNGFSEKLVIKNGIVRMFNKSGTEQTDNVPHITDIKILPSTDLIIVGEGWAPSGRVEDAKSIFGSGREHALRKQDELGLANFTAVSVLRDGQSITDVSFGERRPILEDAINELLNAGAKNVFLESLVSRGKRELFERVVASGGEGVVIKKMSGTELDWFKVKKTYSWDAVIIGFTSGRGKYSEVIGAIRYGFCDQFGNVRETGKCSGMTDDMRRRFAEDPASFIGKVVEIKGQGLGNRGGIVFPRFVRIRDDKLPVHCTMPTR